MSKSLSGLFSGTNGDKKYKKQQELNLYSMVENLNRLSKIYSVTKGGYFGERGKSSRVRVISSTNQFKEAQKFWDILSKGGRISELPNKHGIRVDFEDYSYATYRVVTSTKDSPAVDIRVFRHDNIKSQKIHFIRKEKK